MQAQSSKVDVLDVHAQISTANYSARDPKGLHAYAINARF